MAGRQVGAIAMALAVIVAGVAHADTIYTESFNAPDQPLASYSSNYVVATGINADILNNRLRVSTNASYPNNSQTGVRTLSGLIGTPGPGSLVKGNINQNWPPNFNAFLKLGGNIAYRASANRNAFWDSVWNFAGSSQVTAGGNKQFAVLYVGGPGDSRTAHTFVQKQYNASFTDDLDFFGQQVGPVGDQVQMHIQGPASNSAVWCEYDNLAVFGLSDNGPGAVAAAKAAANLGTGFFDNFNRPDSATIGSAWSEVVAGGAVDIGIVGNRVEIEIARVDSGSPWGRAMLDLTHPSVLGRGLEVGEMIEWNMQRPQNRGNLGFNLFGPNHAFTSTTSGLNVWQDRYGTDQGSTWNRISPAALNHDPNQVLDMALRLDYADGEQMLVSYYAEGDYLGSWLYDTAATTINSFGFMGQSSTVGDRFVFDDIRISVIPEPVTLVMLAGGLAALAARRRRRRA
ncbi:PEP-CTERM sorting domain-containing protein [Planctomycetota bacterium]